MSLYDGHIHSPYCPHGTKDDFETYITRAIQLGYTGMTFTEHAPLPKGFIDPTPDKDSGMSHDLLYKYIDHLIVLKHKYKHVIDIRIGLEVDYIEGFEEETTLFLNDVGPMLDDSILSVHFLQLNNTYYCIDYSLNVFEEALKECHRSLETLYEKYIKTLSHSIAHPLGSYKPKRIGHITLLTKFQKVYPMPHSANEQFIHLLHLIAEEGLSLDYNGAGTHKPMCGDTYPTNYLALRANELGIPLIYGSDAHQATALGQGLSSLNPHVPLSKPIEDTK